MILEGFNPHDPGIQMLAEAVHAVMPKELLLAFCGPLPGIASGATALVLDVREVELHQRIGNPYLFAQVLTEVPDLPQVWSHAAVWPRAHLGKDFSERCLAQGGLMLRPGGKLWCAVRKRKGAHSLAITMEELFANIRIVDRNRGYYLYMSEKTCEFNQPLATEIMNTHYLIAEDASSELPLLSVPGIFSRKQLDLGTKALIEYLQIALPETVNPRRILDLCAGIGPLSVWAAKRWPEAKILAIESNVLAAALLTKNAARRGCEDRVYGYLGAGFPSTENLDEHQPEKQFVGQLDLALINPPTHNDAASLQHLFAPLGKWLRSDASAWFVVCRLGSVPTVLKDIGANIEIYDAKTTNSQYQVIRAQWNSS